MTYLADGFADVDKSNDPTHFMNCLNAVTSLQWAKNYKNTVLKILDLKPGNSVLEIGCGLGDDVIALAKKVGPNGKVVAVDVSKAMIEKAKKKLKGQELPVEFIVADAQELDIKNTNFDAARVDRVLQHMPDPFKALKKMAQIVRPGGKIVAIEPDWETFIISSQYKDTTRKLMNLFCENIPSGWIGRYLYGYFRDCGITDIQVLPENLIIHNLDLADKVFDIYQTAKTATEQKLITKDQATRWVSDIEHIDRTGKFFCALTGFIVSGIKS